MSILQVKDLSFTYPSGTQALKNINLSVEEGEVLAIIGQNGSGKTTLVRHFNGLLKPTSGEIFLQGQSIADKSVGELSRTVGYVFQNPNHQLFCTSVREELEVGPTNFGFSPEEMKDRVEKTIELLGIDRFIDEHPLTLDYTSKKILTIASVLTFNPQIFIMDEPTGGLDEAGRVLLRKIIEKLRGAGHTVIMISHDMDFVAETMDRVIVMANARIVQDSNIQEAFKNEAVMKEAWIEPPQITQLGYELFGRSFTAASVEEFVKYYKQ